LLPGFLLIYLHYFGANKSVTSKSCIDQGQNAPTGGILGFTLKQRVNPNKNPTCTPSSRSGSHSAHSFALSPGAPTCWTSGRRKPIWTTCSRLRSWSSVSATGPIHTEYQPVHTMIIFQFFKSLFAQPNFAAGERVNLIVGGSISRTDGFVVGQTDSGVLVEWPRGGSSFVNANQLSAIG
jgi:hypothetical protein